MLFKCQNLNLVRVALSVFFTTFTSLSAWTTTFITDVMVIGSYYKSDVEDLKSNYQKQGWTVINKDLNAGCGDVTDFVYLMYKTCANSEGVYEYITDFYIRGSNSKSTPDQITHNGRTYYLAPYDGSSHFKDLKGDLNSNAGGDYIHIYYTKDPFPDNRAVTSIYFNSTQSGAVGKNGDSTGYDLNSGASGEYIYMHFTTETSPWVQGSGTEGDPYIIYNLEGWNEFASNISSGNNYSGTFVKLARNVSGVTTIAGDLNHPFSGIFDGNNKTLTVNITGPSASDASSMAPFRKISDATIKDLTVQGSVKGQGNHAAGLVGGCAGNCTITGCKVNVQVTGVGYAGGLVGHAGSNQLTLTDSYFDGTISGFNNFAGGLVGWCDNLNFTITNCLFKGSFSPASGGQYHPIILSNNGSRASGTVTDTYYLYTSAPTVPGNSTKRIAGADGFAVSPNQIDGTYYILVTAVDGNIYYAETASIGLITQTPEGQVKYYSRSGGAYYKTTDSQIVKDVQQGTMTMIYGENNTVYMFEPFSRTITNSYIRGTKSGNTITINLPQVVFYVDGLIMELAWVNISNDGTGTVDRSTTTATFTIDGNTIRLNGSNEKRVLGGVWQHNNSWYGAGDFESVFTWIGQDPISPPSGSTPATYYYNGTTYYSSTNHDFSSTVQVVKNGNDVYIKGLATGDNGRVILPNAWAKGTLNGKTLTIPKGQFMGMYNNNPIYLVGYDADNNSPGDITFTYDAHSEIYTLNNLMYVSIKSDEINYYTSTRIGATISASASVDELVVVPNGAVIENDWVIEGTYYTSADNSYSVNKTTQVAFDGNDVYIKGLAKNYPNSWIKGTLNGNIATFYTGQYMGNDSSGKDYLLGYDDGDICDIVFRYDNYAKKFTLTTPAVIESSMRILINIWGFYLGLSVYKSGINTDPITEAPEGETRYYNRSGGSYTYQNGKAIRTEQTEMITIIYGDDDTVYMLNPVCYLPGGLYVRGKISGNTITVDLPQKLYLTNQGVNLELAWVDIPANVSSSFNPSVATTDRTATVATFTIDGNTIRLNGSSMTRVLGAVRDDDDQWYGAGDYESIYTLTTPEEPITPPAGITPVTYSYTGSTYYYDENHDFSTMVQVVKDGNDVYIQGLATADDNYVILPEAWAKGTLNGNTLTIPKGQYMGMFSGSAIYLYSSADIKFTYDAGKGTFTLNNNMYVNIKKDAVYYYSRTNAGATLTASSSFPTSIADDNTANGNDNWYSIDGKRLNEQPKAKGLYIHNGQKVVVK